VTDEEDSAPDGVIIVHFPADGSAPYGVGPFPPIPDLVDSVLTSGSCTCKREPMPVVFPKGIRMMVDATDQIVEVMSLFADVEVDDDEARSRLN
jgi:hypothetical protein